MPQQQVVDARAGLRAEAIATWRAVEQVAIATKDMRQPAAQIKNPQDRTEGFSALAGKLGAALLMPTLPSASTTD